MKEVIGDKVEKVIMSDRIVDLPLSLSTSEYGWSDNMKRIAQQPNSSHQQQQDNQLQVARQTARQERDEEREERKEKRKVEVDEEGRAKKGEGKREREK